MKLDTYGRSEERFCHSVVERPDAVLHASGETSCVSNLPQPRLWCGLRHSGTSRGARRSGLPFLSSWEDLQCASRTWVSTMDGIDSLRMFTRLKYEVVPFFS